MRYDPNTYPMPETWGLGQLVEFVRETGDEEARVGRTLVLFGVVSLVGGVGVFALTGALRMAAGDVWAFRTAAGVFVGVGLPASLYGLVVLTSGGEQAVDVGRVGLLCCSVAVLGFLLTYPERWVAEGASGFAVVTLVVYGLGAMLCSAAAGSAVLAHLEGVEEPDETGFIWGNPPDG